MKVLPFQKPNPAPKGDPAPDPEAAASPAAGEPVVVLDPSAASTPVDPDTPAAAPVPVTLVDEPRHYDRITVRAITIALVLSLFIHILVLVSPLMSKVEQEMKAPADEIGPLSVTIAQSKPQPKAPEPNPPAAVEEAKPVPPKPAPRSKPTPARPQSRMAITTGNRPPFVVPPPIQQNPAPPAPAAAPAPTPMPTTNEDFSEMLAARQRARRAENGGAPDEVLESDDQRANRIARANVEAQQRSASPGQDPDQGGGIFDLRHTGLHDAEFVFLGWNRDFRRNIGQTVEVKQGDAPDIQTAVIRRMIEIIREKKPGDFEWQSHRLGKVVIMSARPQDQAELERFLLKEMYPNDPRVR